MKVLLIEDHKMFGESLKTTLEQSNEIEVNLINHIDEINEEYLLSIIKSNSYDVILMDINLSGLSKGTDGLDLSKTLLNKDKNLKIVILTGYDLEMYKKEAENIGCYGFISKEEDTQQLIKKLKNVCYDDIKEFEKWEDNFEELTEKELEIIRLYASGLSRQEVAEKCFISIRSLAVSLNRIYSKLEVRNYQEMINKVLELGYIKQF